MNAANLERPVALKADAPILASIVEASRDACWCMEFDPAVDLTAPDSEVVRQVFENAPRWTLANRAMHELYMLPAGEDLCARPVAEIFPRNPQNEAFVLNLLANGFEVDAAPALDSRYDGQTIYVENDVRAHVEGGRLLRMFGTVRDVGKHRRRAEDLRRRLAQAEAAFSALPDPALLLDGEGRVVAANVAATRLLGAEPAGRAADALAPLGLADAADRALAAAVSGGPVARREAGGRLLRAVALPEGGTVLVLTEAGA